MTSRVGALAAISTILALSGPASADELEEGGRLYAIQNRKHVVTHEFALGVGVVPLDAFYKGVTGTFGYTYHFNDLWAWEIASATYSLNLNTGLRDDLETNWNVKPTEFPELTFFVDSNLIFKPLYSKAVFLNESLIYAELFLAIGPAVAHYQNAGVFVGADIGVGIRVYLSKSFALRFDIRDYEFFSASNPKDTQNELFLQAGIGLSIP